MICRFGNNSADDEENYQMGFEEINKVYECTFGKNKQYDGILMLSSDLKDICIRSGHVFLLCQKLLITHLLCIPIFIFNYRFI